jgi:hypothetical protein
VKEEQDDQKHPEQNDPDYGENYGRLVSFTPILIPFVEFWHVAPLSFRRVGFAKSSRRRRADSAQPANRPFQWAVTKWPGDFKSAKRKRKVPGGT